MKIILGSQSPRRKEILSYFSLPFVQESSDFDEESLPYNGDPIAYVKALAIGKAETLKAKHPDDCIITADTIVAKDGKIYGKPTSEEHALEMLLELSGSTHSVFTAVVLMHEGRLLADVEETKVTFVPLSEAQARNYHEKLYCKDKAGGYAVQNAGSLVVKGIEGCFYNVMGLPIQTLEKLLSQAGISLWNFLDCATV